MPITSKTTRLASQATHCILGSRGGARAAAASPSAGTPKAVLPHSTGMEQELLP